MNLRGLWFQGHFTPGPSSTDNPSGQTAPGPAMGQVIGAMLARLATSRPNARIARSHPSWAIARPPYFPIVSGQALTILSLTPDTMPSDTPYCADPCCSYFLRAGLLAASVDGTGAGGNTWAAEGAEACAGAATPCSGVAKRARQKAKSPPGRHQEAAHVPNPKGATAQRRFLGA